MGQVPDSPLKSGTPAALTSDASPAAGSSGRLIDRIREAIRSRHYSRSTEKTYWYWIKYFIVFSGKRHPLDLGTGEVTAFLSWLATERNVAAATQNQALSAILFLYKQVLGRELPWLDGMTRAKQPVRLPTVLTEAEVSRLLSRLDGVKWLMVSLMYGSGLRHHESLTLFYTSLVLAGITAMSGS